MGKFHLSISNLLLLVLVAALVTGLYNKPKTELIQLPNYFTDPEQFSHDIPQFIFVESTWRHETSAPIPLAIGEVWQQGEKLAKTLTQRSKNLGYKSWECISVAHHNELVDRHNDYETIGYYTMTLQGLPASSLETDEKMISLIVMDESIALRYKNHPRELEKIFEEAGVRTNYDKEVNARKEAEQNAKLDVALENFLGESTDPFAETFLGGSTGQSAFTQSTKKKQFIRAMKELLGHQDPTASWSEVELDIEKAIEALEATAKQSENDSPKTDEK